MQPTLFKRILHFAEANRKNPKWKKRLYALLYGCVDLTTLNKIR